MLVLPPSELGTNKAVRTRFRPWFEPFSVQMSIKIQFFPPADEGAAFRFVMHAAIEALTASGAICRVGPGAFAVAPGST